MKFRVLWMTMGFMALLAGCSTGPWVSDSQLTAEEIREGIEIPQEERWVEPLTEQQHATLVEARRAWSNGNLEKARELLDGLLQVRPDHPDLLANGAIVAMAEDRKETARTLFEEALKVAPGHRVASNNLALLLKGEGDFVEARRVLTRALERHPDDPTLHYNLGVVYELYLQNLEKALKHYHRYQGLSEEPDPKVAGWIIDLERRVDQ
jgi:tetratricopeptide (TPR) repeat protein